MKVQVVMTKQSMSIQTSNSDVRDPETPLPQVPHSRDTQLTPTLFTPPSRTPSFSVSLSDSDVSTPKSQVFDPFAPGPEELIFAPRSKKLISVIEPTARLTCVRRLEF